MHEQKQIYSLRKLSVGLASVIVGTCFFISNGQQVKADTVNVGEQQASTVIQQDSSKKQDSNEQNDQTNVSNSKTEQQQSTPSAKDVGNVDSNLNDTNKLDNTTKPVESEANQKFDQVKDKFKQDTSIDADVPSSVTKNIKKIQTNTLKVVKESTVNPNSLSLKESKAVNLNTNGGFDSSWGTLDVNDWQGSVQGDYYVLIHYVADNSDDAHIVVPNEADFEKAGISTGGKQVAVTNDFFKNIQNYSNTSARSTRRLAFSKTAGKQVKAIGNNWTDAFSEYGFSKFNGENLDVSEVTNMHNMFSNCNNLSDISSLAHWDTSNVANMSSMFEDCLNLSDISPLANWDTSKVTYMYSMFENTPLKKVTLTNWDFSNIDPSHASSIFPDTNFEATLSDKTSKSLLDISSKLSDPAKEALKVVDSAPIVDGVPDVYGEIQEGLDEIKQRKEEYQQQLTHYKQQIDYYQKELADPNADAAAKENNQSELKHAEQEYQYYLTGDGKKSFDKQIQDFQEEFNQYKQDLQQQITLAKLQAEYPLNSVFGNHSKITTPNQDLLVYLVGKLPVKSDATRTIEITLPDGTKKTINQSVGYGKHAISGTADMATHKLDMSMPYELSKWELIKKEDGSYDLVKAHVDENGVASFDNVALPKVAGYKAVVTPAKQNAINPMAQMFMVSFVALPKQPNTEQSSTSSSSVPNKANNSHDLHDDSKTQNDQRIVSSNKTDHTINVSAQVVDPTVEPADEHNVASQNNSTTSAQTQQSSTNDAEQPENSSNKNRVVNDQTDDDNFAASSREQNESNKGSNSSSDRSKPDSGKDYPC